MYIFDWFVLQKLYYKFYLCITMVNWLASGYIVCRCGEQPNSILVHSFYGCLGVFIRNRGNKGNYPSVQHACKFQEKENTFKSFLVCKFFCIESIILASIHGNFHRHVSLAAIGLLFQQ